MKQLIALLLLTIVVFGNAFSQGGTGQIEHKVEAGQTLFFISKKYNLSIDELRASNPDILEDLIIRPDQVLKIKQKIVAQPVVETNVSYKTHVVETKETLYSLSKKFNISVDELIRMNDLESPSIKIGQVLKVEKFEVNNEALFATKPVKPTTPAIVVPNNDVKPQVVIGKPNVDYKKPENKSDQLVKPDEIVVNPEMNAITLEANTDSDLYKMLFDSYEGEGIKLQKDKGIANFLSTGDGNSFYAMVNDVPVESVIRVRNLMNNKVAYLKVVGGLPSNTNGKNVSLKISSAAAKDLNIIEDRFLAEWSWYEGEMPSKVEDREPVLFDDF